MPYLNAKPRQIPLLGTYACTVNNRALLGKMESQNVDSLPARIYNIFVTVQYLNSHAQKSIKEKNTRMEGETNR